MSDLDTKGREISGVTSIRSTAALIDIREMIDRTEEGAGADPGGQALDLGHAQDHGPDSDHHRWWGCDHRCALIQDQKRGQSLGRHCQPYRIRLHHLLSGLQKEVGDVVGDAYKCFSGIFLMFASLPVMWSW